MKLSLISTVFATALAIGCAAHKVATPVAAPVTPVVQTVTLPALPAPDAGVAPSEDAGTTSNETPSTDEQKSTYEAEPNADGTAVSLKGADWELQVTMGQGWRPVPIPVEFAMYNRNSSLLVMVRRVPSITSVNALHTSQMEELKQAEGTLVPGTLKTVKVNGAPAKTWKGNIKGGTFQEWEFLMLGKDPSTGTGLIFSCGGPASKVAANPKVCSEVLKSFYIGRAPSAP